MTKKEWKKIGLITSLDILLAVVLFALFLFIYFSIYPLQFPQLHPLASITEPLSPSSPSIPYGFIALYSLAGIVASGIYLTLVYFILKNDDWPQKLKIWLYGLLISIVFIAFILLLFN